MCGCYSDLCHRIRYCLFIGLRVQITDYRLQDREPRAREHLPKDQDIIFGHIPRLLTLPLLDMAVVDSLLLFDL